MRNSTGAILFTLYCVLLPTIIYADVSNSPLDKSLNRLSSSYHVIRAGTGHSLDELSSVNVNGRIYSDSPASKILDFHKNDKLPVFLYVFDGKSAFHLDDHKARRNAFLKDSTNREFLKRDPSLLDPAVRVKLHDHLLEFLRGYKNCDLLAACVCHEGSNVTFGSPFDYDYSDFGMAAFRKWLATRYSSIAAVNKVWSSNYKLFNDVIPKTTDEAIDQEYKNFPYMDLTSWCEFREFMDISFIEIIHSLADAVRKESPGLPTAVTVTAMPTVYSGWDYARLLAGGKIDVVETHRFPGDKGLIRGLDNNRTISFSSHYNNGDKGIRKLWLDFLNGERGAFVATATVRGMLKGDGQSKESWKKMFEDMGDFAALIKDCRLVDGGVSMIYSQPSIRTFWFVDNMPDEKTYPLRGAVWEVEHNTYIKTLGGWQVALGEQGIHPKFESYLDLQKGKFRGGKPKVLIANLMHAVSDSTLSFLKSYVSDGGVLVIDDTFAMYDEKGKPRGPGPIPFTSLKRGATFSYRSSFGEIKKPNKKRGVTKEFRHGAGRVVLFNATFVDYGSDKRGLNMRVLRKKLSKLLSDAEVNAGEGMGVKFTALPNSELFIFEGQGGSGYLAVASTTEQTQARTIQFNAVNNGNDIKIIDIVSGMNLEKSITVPVLQPVLLKIKTSK